MMETVITKNCFIRNDIGCDDLKIFSITIFQKQWGERGTGYGVRGTGKVPKFVSRIPEGGIAGTGNADLSILMTAQGVD